MTDEQALVQAIWQEHALSPAFLEEMGRICPWSALSPAPDDLSLGNLPRWICRSGGGQARAVIPVSVAWNLLLRTFAVFDNIEDGDVSLEQPQLAVWLNAALGLLFTASSALQRLEAYGVEPATAMAIRYQFYPALLPMFSGQHQALTLQIPTLDEYWAVTAAKIGTPFGLVCWTAARLARSDAAYLEGWRQFGLGLGVLAQIKDDLLDLWDSERAIGDFRRYNSLALPSVYALDVLPPDEQAELRRCLREAPHSPVREQQARQMVIESGAGVYLAVQSSLQYDRLVGLLTGLISAESDRQPLLDYLALTRLVTP